MSYSSLCFLMIRGNIPANSFPKKAVVGCGWPNCAAAGLVLGSMAELWQGSPLGLAVSPPVVLNRYRGVQGVEGHWMKLWVRYVTEILVELETTTHLKPGVELHDPCGTFPAQGTRSSKWVMSEGRAWHCYFFRNVDSLLRYSTVSVIRCLWQSLFVCQVME